MGKIRDIILSLHPKYWEMFKNGTKCVELRRKIWKHDVANIWIYVTHPIMAILGIITKFYVDYAPIQDLWERYGDYSGITYDQFQTYFHGLTKGYAIVPSQILVFHEAKKVSNFTPPQNFCYVKTINNIINKIYVIKQ